MRGAFPPLGFALLFGCSLPPLACSGGPFAKAFPWDEPLPSPIDSPVVDASRLHRFEFENGALLLVLEDKRLPAFSLGFTAPRGAAVEAPGREGVARYTADLMERGAGDRDALELAAAVEALGAGFSVSSGWDSFGVSIGGLSRDLPALFDIFSDVLLSPRFDKAEAKRARGEQLAALRTAGDDPDTLAGWTFSKTLYPEHRLGLPISGTSESVEKLDAAAARAFYEKIFTPRQGVFHAVGDVDAEDIRRRIEAAFGAWQGPVPVQTGPAPAAAAGAEAGAESESAAQAGWSAPRIVLVDRPELGQAHVVVGHAGIAQGAEDRDQVSLLNTMFGGGGFSSRLMARLRAEEGLTYSVYSNFGRRRGSGYFAIRSFTEVAELEPLLKGLFEEFERMRSLPPDEDELSRAKTLSTGRFALALETAGAVMSSLVDLEIYDLPRDSLDTYRGRVRALTADKISEAAERYLRPSHASVVIVAPADKVRTLLEAHGPVTLITP